MIPLPPDDPALPSLHTMLDRGDMVALLNSHLPDCIEGRFRVVRCRPTYIRYKHGTSCLVGYDFRLLRDDGKIVKSSAFTWLYADDRGETRWAKRSLHKLIDRAARRHPKGPRQRAIYLPDLRALVQLFPVDLDLRALVDATQSARMRRIAREALGDGSEWLADAKPKLIRYKPARKALLRVALPGGADDAIYVKLHTDDRGAYLREAGAALLQHGVATAKPLAYLADTRMLIHATAPGMALTALRGTTAFTPWMEPVAEALARLQATDLPCLPVYGLSTEAETTHLLTSNLGRLLPDMAPRLDRLGARLTASLMTVPPASATVHGDFYDDQTLVSDAGITLIDLDEARRAHPLLDVGNMLAHLSTGELRGEATAGDGRAAFLDAALRDRPVTPHEVALFEALALLKLAPGPFRRLEGDWPEGVERIVDLAERRLGEHLGGAPSTNGWRLEAASPTSPAPVELDQSAPVDPKLPQLQTLHDSAFMAGTLERTLYHEPTAIHRVALVRHKPGRRAILRYDVAIGPAGASRREQLYGKTFASDRGPRVYANALKLCAAQVCGTTVCLPEPVAYVPDLKLLLQRAVPGWPAGPALLAGDEALAARIATALHCLHSSGLDLDRRHPPTKELDPLQARVGYLGAVCPALRAPAERCLRLIETGRDQDWTWRWQPIHRDFYHDQVLIDGATLAVLDLDDAAMSEPAIDVANFVAHLRLLGIQACGNAAALNHVITAFTDRSYQLDTALDPALVRFLDGATLLRLAAIHLPRDDGETVARLLLAESEHLLRTSPAIPHTAVH